MVDDKKFFNYIKKEMNSKEIKKSKLATIYKYLGDKEKALKLLESITNYEMPETRYNVIGITEEDKKDTHFLNNLGQNQIVRGIQFNLAHKYPENARQFFVWAAENCFIPESAFKEWTGIKQFDLIAVGYLWRGYALLMLGRYEEALELLKQVPLYFNKDKLRGGEVWQIYEPKLVKALLPLCEYELDSSEENRMKARKGLEDYIGLFREPKFKLEGYLYYYHLKEMFPDVYSEKLPEIKPINETARPMVEPVGKFVEPERVDIKGTVFVSDSDRNNLWPFGTVNDLLRYVERVKSLGDYPLLSSLMDVYGVEETAGFEPGPLIEECEKLLSISDDSWLRDLTESILKVAEKALHEGLGVILYLEPDVE